MSRRQQCEQPAQTGILQSSLILILRRQPTCRVLFSALKDIAKQLENMQMNNVIYTSEFPGPYSEEARWITMDYRALNSVTKPDLSPLP